MFIFYLIKMSTSVLESSARALAQFSIRFNESEKGLSNILSILYIHRKSVLLNVLHFPASTQRGYNVITTSRRCSDVVRTLLRRCVFAGFVIQNNHAYIPSCV